MKKTKIIKKQENMKDIPLELTELLEKFSNDVEALGKKYGFSLAAGKFNAFGKEDSSAFMALGVLSKGDIPGEDARPIRPEEKSLLNEILRHSLSFSLLQ